MVPIPEGVERTDEEPPSDTYSSMSGSDGGSFTGTDSERVTLGSGDDEDEIRG